MIDTIAIKNKILNLAISGKLTEQCGTDGSAEDCYAQIQENKENLIKTKVIKRKQVLPEIKDEEKAFDIPYNWKWVRLAQICLQITDGTHKTPKYQNEGVPFLSVKNISAGFLDLSDIKYISKEEHEELLKRCRPQRDDVLVCRIGTLGKALRINTDMEFSVFVSLGLIKTGNKILSDYICAVINSGYGSDWIQANKAGGAMHAYKINLNDLKMMPIPLPPIAEQDRILDSIDEIQSNIAVIDEMQVKYYKDVELLKSKLIDAGICGKLTHSTSEDESAEELYSRIRTERKQAAKEGKIKKDIELPEVSETDFPFEIPSTWKWIRLWNVVSVLGGKRIPAGRKLTTDDTGHKYIRVSEMKERTVITSNLLFVPEDIYPSISRYIINKEDVYITVAGTIGRVGKIPEEIDGANLTENADRLVFTNLDQEWLIYCLSSSVVQKQIEMLTTQVAQPKLAIKRIQEFILPLPPMEEQKRIAARIEEIMPLISG